jgi:hypothetical protein
VDGRILTEVVVLSRTATEVDGAAFMLLCQHYGIAVEAGKQLLSPAQTGGTSGIGDGKSLGLTVETAGGGRKKDPLLQMFKENSQMSPIFINWYGRPRKEHAGLSWSGRIPPSAN